MDVITLRCLNNLHVLEWLSIRFVDVVTAYLCDSEKKIHEIHKGFKVLETNDAFPILYSTKLIISLGNIS